MTMTVTNIDQNNGVISREDFQDGLLTLAGADTIAVGTILAVDSSTKKFVLFVKGGTTNENGIPKAVLTVEKTSTGAGDVAIRPMIKGKWELEKLVIDADGDSSNVDQTVRDQLRDYGIVVKNSPSISVLDNQ